jgi:hypothetical protein
VKKENAFKYLMFGIAKDKDGKKSKTVKLNEIQQ